MPINGPGGPTGPRPISPTRTDALDTTTPAQPTSPTAPAAQGWTATGVQGQAIGSKTNLPALNVMGAPPPIPNPVEQGMKQAVDRFTGRIQTTLHHDAMSLARGQSPVREGDPLTEAQQHELQSAATDFVKDIPIGALSPEVAAAVQGKLKDAGIETRDLASTKLGDLGKVGGDIAKDLIKDLRRDSPTAFYSLAGAAAAAVGYTAWAKGSDGLSKLGVKPEVKQKFFDDHLQVKLGAEWESHFKDLKATATVSGNVNVGDHGKLSASVTGNSKTGFDNARLEYAYANPNLNLSASAYATANRDGLESAGGRFTYNPSKDFSLSAGVDHNFQTGRTNAMAEASWKVNKSTDFALSARHDSAGESSVGVGLAIRF